MEKQGQEQRKPSFVFQVARAVFGVVFHTIGPVKYVGTEKLPSQGPCILIANHQSWVDPILMAYPIRACDITFLGKKELAKNRLMRWAMHDAHVILVDRHATDMEAMRACIRTLRGGEILGICPEGTRHRGGTMQELESGVALMALRSGAPLVPMYIHPKFRLFQKNHCVVGDPIPFEDLRAQGVNNETCHALLERISAVYAKMADECGAKRKKV